MAHVAYSLEDKHRALLELAMSGGSAYQAARRLKARGGIYKGMSTVTLHKWREEHEDAYVRLRTQYEKNLAEHLAAETEDIIRREGKVQHKLLDKLEKSIEKIPAKDVPGALRNVAVSQAVAQDKIVNPIRGRGVIVEHRSADTIRAELEAKARRLGLLVEGTAEEVTEDPPGLPGATAE